MFYFYYFIYILFCLNDNAIIMKEAQYEMGEVVSAACTATIRL